MLKKKESGSIKCLSVNTSILVVTSALDSSDRMTASTLSYDLLGRIKTAPLFLWQQFAKGLTVLCVTRPVS